MARKRAADPHAIDHSPHEMTAVDVSSTACETGVGQQLRALRMAHQLTIRGLAERSGLAVNTLSMIENDKTSPSVSTLQQLARALGEPITAFFATEAQQKPVVYARSQQRPRARMETTCLEYLGKDLAGSAVQPFVVTLDLGAGSGTRLIVHTGHEFVYCLSGKVLYTIADQPYLLEPGDSLVFESHLQHRWQNVDAGPSQIILVLYPADLRDTPTEHHFSIQV